MPKWSNKSWIPVIKMMVDLEKILYLSAPVIPCEARCLGTFSTISKNHLQKRLDHKGMLKSNSLKLLELFCVCLAASKFKAGFFFPEIREPRI